MMMMMMMMKMTIITMMMMMMMMVPEANVRLTTSVLKISLKLKSLLVSIVLA